MSSAQGDSQGGAKQPFLPEYPELDPFAGLIFEKLIESTKLANELPSSDDFAYYNTFKPFKGPVQVIGKKILNLANKFLRHRKPRGEVLETLDDVTESYDSVVDLMDEIVEDVVSDLSFLFHSAVQIMPINLLLYYRTEVHINRY